MTKRQRTILFLVLSGLFAVTAPSLALYSQGYRIDVAQRRIAQTGAFYFKVAPARADIFVDGNSVKRTDFLFGSALTKNFFPGQHLVEIAKEGYHSWQKILEIKERQVTEAKNILLFKKDPAFQRIADQVVDFWVSPDKQYALLEKLGPGNSWQLRLLNVKTLGEEPFLEQKNSRDSIVNIRWAKDSKRFLLQRGLKEQLVSEVHSIVPGQPCSKTPCSLEYLGGSIGDIAFLPSNADYIVFTKFLNTTQVLFSAEYATKEAPNALANNIAAFEPDGSWVMWLDKEGVLWEQDITAKAPAQIFSKSMVKPQQEVSSAIYHAGDSVLLLEDTALSLEKKSSAKRQTILSSALEVLLSPDGTKAAVRNSSELWILFLREETEQPQHQEGELILLTRFSNPPEQLSWIDSSYLLFTFVDTIKTIEIDNRDRLNVADIAEFPNPELFWDNEKGTLYVLSEGAFSVSEKIVK